MRSCLWFLCMLLLASAVAADEYSVTEYVPPSAGFSATDTLRTSVWIAETLFSELVVEAAAWLPDPPANVELVVPRGNDARDLLLTIAARHLLDTGYAVFEREFPIGGKKSTTDDEGADDEEEQQVEEEDVLQPPVCFDGELYLSLEKLEMNYPVVGRRFGLWRQWVDRELSVAMFVKVGLPATGEVIFRDRLVRCFVDRVPAGDLAGTESDAYAFSNAELSEVGWRGRTEQLVVLGALTGLIAVYFSNAE